MCAALLLAGCARAPAGEVARPALWRATDGDTTIWLLGTIHLLPVGVDWQGGEIARAVRESDTLVTEIPPGNPQAQAAAFLKLARAEGLPPIDQRVPPAIRPALGAAIKAAGVSEATLDRLATWGAALALGAASVRVAGASRDAGPEAVLARAFAGRRQEAFESFSGQLEIFAALSERDQRALLTQAVADARDPAGEYAKLLTAWGSGDPAALNAVYAAALKGQPGLEAALVTGRNRAWAAALARRAARPGVLLVAVGAGHMLGSAGLPALLSERGFRVARVQ